LTSSSFNLALNGTIEQEAGLVDAIPALKVLNSLPKIGGLLKTFNDSAKLKGEISPSLNFGANFAQDATGKLLFKNGSGNLDINLKTTLSSKISDRINARLWASGGGGAVLGVPDPHLSANSI